MITTDSITIRTEIHPGGIGYVTYLHGKVYQQEYGYNHNFEMYVAKSISEFREQFTPGQDRPWIVENGDKIVGSIVIMSRSGHVAQLRYFVLLPEYRGLGLGKKLVQMAMDFGQTAGYKSVYLWTADELHTAAKLYGKFGFQKTKAVSTNHWGKEVTENCYDMSF